MVGHPGLGLALLLLLLGGMVELTPRGRAQLALDGVVPGCTNAPLTECSDAAPDASSLAGLRQPTPDFTAWLADEMRAWNIPGASIAVFNGYQLTWAAGFGVRDTASGAAVTPATRFQAASVSKPIAALAALIAFDHHGHSIEADLSRLLPSLPSRRGTGTWELVNPYPTPVTLRMLLSHTGGTSDFRYVGYRAGIDPLPTLPQELSGTPPTNTPPVAVVREPGVHWVYSPAGYTIVQAVLEDLEDQPFAAIMERRLLAPLGMTDSTFEQPPPPPVAAAMAVPYLPDGAPLADGPRIFTASAAGGLTTTAGDLARLMLGVQRALTGDGSGPIAPAIARAMIVRQPGVTLPGQCFSTADPARSACQSSQGLGFDVNLDRNLSHAPDGEPTGAWFGHTGFNSGYLSVVLGSKTGGNGLALLVNTAPEDMSGDVPQFPFLLHVVRRVADDHGWR
jgi:CubicO group peptidase (beta-lactamase class C family)